MRIAKRACTLLSMMIVLALGGHGQSPESSPTPTPTPKSTTNFFKDIARDQKAIWTSPFHAHRSDLKWMIPFGVGTAALIASDKETSEWVKSGGSLPSVSKKVSWGGSVYGTVGFAGGMWAIGRATHNDKLAETGRLATEALVNSEIVTQVSKLAFGRLRPDEGDGEGRFFKGGRSFFSGHSSAAWSIASVVACEYNDHPLIVFASYGLASAVGLSRYTGRNHFLSDVVVGAAVGYGIGRFVCHNRGHHLGKDADQDDTTTVSWRPTVTPYFDPRTGSRGGRLSWNF